MSDRDSSLRQRRGGERLGGPMVAERADGMGWDGVELHFGNVHHKHARYPIQTPSDVSSPLSILQPRGNYYLSPDPASPSAATCLSCPSVDLLLSRLLDRLIDVLIPIHEVQGQSLGRGCFERR